jgi:diguanylate cyclase (GGDEF)-like protein/PAS domain S-box-containing protein
VEATVAEHLNRKRLAHDVLENVVDSVEKKTPFQRVLATCYNSLLRPDSQTSTTIVEFATRGLSEADEQMVDDTIRNRTEVCSARYQGRYRIGNSYFFPEGESLARMSPVIPSSRRFLSRGGWDHRDVLLIPFWLDGQILGQISVDDPRDGKRPNPGNLTLLEEKASVAALALWDACSLEELNETHRLYQFLATSAITGLVVVQNERIRYANDRAEALLGYDKPTLGDLAPWWNFLHPDDRPYAWHGAWNEGPKPQLIRAVRRDGRGVWFSICAHQMIYRGEEATAIQFYDVTDRIEAETQLKDKALRDPLTALRNRAYFDETIHLEVFRCQRYKRSFTLMIADLRSFKSINDTLGHQEGDRILAGVAELMRNELRESDWIVRYGGDEFLLVLPETGQDMEALVRRLQREVAAWAEGNIRVGVPFGVDFGWSTWSPDAPLPVKDLLKRADDMLYEQKRANSTGESRMPGSASGEGNSQNSQR